MLKESVYREDHQPGSHVFREGEPGNCAYVIERGVVEISALRQGRKITIATLGEGELFGEMALIDGEVRASSAVATEETVLVVISLDQLREKFEQADPLLSFFIRNILERFRAFQSRIVGESESGVRHGRPPFLCRHVDLASPRARHAQAQVRGPDQQGADQP